MTIIQRAAFKVSVVVITTCNRCKGQGWLLP